ncbi:MULTISPECIES: cysteine desulfurase family protein [Bradyrhizobium]|uniref:Cysteine desulfurase n=1 Tax=Bradyrhizobium diazoefficiens (strain JCM 10833 / BCRC 13528 / IAM 13628 / NBRC 14792 / USDA 110) TaxID=224911 RepID=Q89M55_BRADU|nr:MULTISPECIES: cysteine desulfurase family protein [Bradyrhizobium]MBP1065652.1 cysteine desulfurase [Bradyrhizobium japonicum]AND89611.1 cysteine desulfurase [Bradyrhizobium diazoefficiens USDA 110]AWO91263.1 cysteine desulfurase [Bradyrhizobium diazoefficiens]PDT58622.1 cysteine desulfurase [Bradyrhizobium diazoefficiens]QBP23100.1 cysteine desulfurase [Bradyrhizobium diazoefficiens]
MPSRVYLDWNATTPLRPEARAAMVAAFDLIGNPSSVHAEGRQARRLVEEARVTLAAAVGALPRNVIFTSAGTEANALALSPGLRGPSGGPVERLLVSAVEHASVLAGGRFPADKVGHIRVTRAGVVDLDHLRALLKDGPPALVSIMAANNETGALQPVAEAARIVHEAGGLLHIDAIQALGKIPFNINAVGADLATFSAHKIGGPKGIGALVVAEGLAGLEPVLRGGGQELNRRAGTENVAGIAGFGAAVKVALQAFPEDAKRMASLRDRLENGIRAIAGATIFSDDTERLPNTILFTAPGLKAETAVIGFDLEGIAVSSGSACSSGKVQPSHVLSAMGFDPAVAQGAVRLSLGWSTEPDDINRALEAWRKLGNTLLRD